MTLLVIILLSISGVVLAKECLEMFDNAMEKSACLFSVFGFSLAGASALFRLIGG